MEDSTVTIGGKGRKKFATSRSKESPELSKSRSGWKNFLNIFLNSSQEKKKDEPKEEVFLDEIDDDFAMAISMPKDVEGKDVEVTIELKAIGKCEHEKKNHHCGGLDVVESTASKSIFAGNIKVPHNVTIEQISKMPLYFINSSSTKRGDGSSTNKIETVIRPLQDNMPSNIERNMLVRNVSLRVQMQNLRKLKKIHDRNRSLNYTFLVKEKKSPKLCDIKLDEIVEDATSADEQSYNETSKSIVREILNQVVSKVQGCNDISTQYSNIITSVSKEIDIQKSLLLHKPIDEKQYCPKLSRRILTSEETLMPKTSTTTAAIDSSIYSSESGSSMYYLKAPTNTPNVQNPRYVIKYDSRVIPAERKHGDFYLKVLPKYPEESKIYVKNSHEKRRREKTRLIDENLRADIDKTLDLLESAKHRLLSYLNPSEYEGERKKKYSRYYKHGELWSESPSYDRIGQYSPPISKRNARKEKSDKKVEEQFFRSKNEEIPDMITFFDMEQPITINTIQNIYDPEVVVKKSSTLMVQDKEMLLKLRYSGDGQHKLAYDVVEGDINMMIKDLLDASNGIKETAIEAIAVKVETCKKLAQDAIINDVKAVMDMLLDRTENEVANKPIFNDLDPPSNNKESVCVKYCIIDEVIHEDNTKALLEDLAKPTTMVSVKRIPSVKTEIMITEDKLTDILQKDSNFIAEICQEVCTVNCKNIFDFQNIETPNNNNTDPEDTNPSPIKPSQQFNCDFTDTEEAETGAVSASEEFIPAKLNVLAQPEMGACSSKKIDNTASQAGSYYLKHAAKIETTFRLPESEPMTSSSGEVVLETLNLQPLVDVKESTITKRSRAAYISNSSSDDLSEVTVRKRLHRMVSPKESNITPAITKALTYHQIIQSPNSSISSRSLYTVHDSDYDGDKDEMVLPNFKQEYVSMQELNNQQEIDDIDENVQRNDTLNVVVSVDELNHKKSRSIFQLIESTESFATSYSLESEISSPETAK